MNEPRAPRLRLAGDGGMTLIETLVAMTVMTLVGALALAGIVQLRRTTASVGDLSAVSSGLHVTFQRLDREIRYAYGITEPATGLSPAGYRYVEYELHADGVRRCTQLRVGGSPGTFQARSRDGAAAAGGWRTLASGVGAGARFTRRDATTSGSPHQQLTVNLAVAAGGAAARSGEYTFTALNTHTGTATEQPVCAGLGRP
ncbi:type II secretion system protein [Spirilliplanes yamanashiensis]|uniref:Prepilin-type N-terminal cleavage/methylation domain-containing protein n=1 Tax=Spirilliplanes yamanashiensis TaxID=42233 RepID=A0A8J3YF11_9ACTN|nr:type II secretion system protein [Spirilliplanes yamanashiensis]MDP9815249.1 prepilin-type N-terminal cleavage/methylation domain-containing protein [Spirilliplanes yamanashiensis]GIJ06482.1 hypothetical protein Sya03_58340 [Spirilliplanes yamanashiensis]